MQTKSNKGGKRSGAGRPLRYGLPGRALNLFFPLKFIDFIRDKADKEANGSVSAYFIKLTGWKPKN